MMTTPLVIGAELDISESLVLQGELHSFAFEASIAAGASYKIGFTSPVNLMFLTSQWRTAADRMRLYSYENVAYTGGTARSLRDRNRELDTAAETLIHVGVTATTVPAATIFGGLFGVKAAGELKIDQPVIHKKNTPYVIELINDAQSQTDVVSVFIVCCEVNIIK